MTLGYDIIDSDILYKGTVIGSLHKSVRDDIVEISKIEIYPEYRASGHARAIMDTIIADADNNGKTLALTPSTDFGANKTRLVAFYRSLGFVTNSGRNKNYATRQAMIRYPKNTSALIKEYIKECMAGIIMHEQVRKSFDIPLPSDLLTISALFKKAGKRFLLVGGAVRDALMGKAPKDLDIATDALPDETIAILQQNPEYKILEVGKSFGVIKVITPEDNEYEIATLRKDLSGGRRPDAVEFTGIEDDANRRDLTINALYYDIERREILDYVGGLQDIESGTIRTVGSAEARFDEDRLRVLRAIRFAGRLGTQLDPSTAAAIKKNNSLQGVSGERIRDEFLKGIKSAKSVPYFLRMINDFDLWSQVFPGLNVVNVPEAYVHTKNTPVQLALLLIGNSPEQIAKALNKANYSSDEVKQVVFLRLLIDLRAQNAYKLKKLFKVSKISNEDLMEFVQEHGSPNIDLVKRFIAYEPSTTGEELQAQGFKGKELGQELERIESEKFNALNESASRTIPDIEIYVDADGVLANFEGRVFNDPESQKLRSDWFAALKQYDKEYLRHMPSEEVNKTFAGIQTDLVMKNLKKIWKEYMNRVHKVAGAEGFFRNLDKMPNADELLKLCYTLTGKLPNILTAPMKENLHCEAEKQEWFEEHFAGQYNRFICQKAKHEFAAPNAILIDDRLRYIRPFVEAGGNAVQYTNYEQVRKDLTALVVKLQSGEVHPNGLIENKNISYTGVVLDERSRNILIQTLQPTWVSEEGWEPIAHHMTIKLGALPDDKKALLGKEITLEVDAYAGNTMVKAVRVLSPIKTKNDVPHITLAVNRKNGGKPVMSNTLTTWKKLKKPLILRGTIQEI